jgi:anti-sigma regulatory factor (Ser/Thr protein kinase)
MKLPNGDRADLSTKIEDYVLNLQHRRGRHKARVFASALGITLGNQTILATALLEAAANSTDVISIGNQGFGERFEIRFPLTTEQGTATVLSAWIIRRGEDFPRLTTCFIV